MRDIFDLIGPDGRRADLNTHNNDDQLRERTVVDDPIKFKASVNNGKLRLVAYGNEHVVEIRFTHKQAKALSAILAKRTTEVWTTPEGTE